MDPIEFQRRLEAAGYYHAGIDGAIGRRSYCALFEFVGKRHLGDMGLALGEAAVIHFAANAINTPLRLSHFMAQTATETGGYAVLEENLNYSAKRMMQVFPSRFKTLAATEGLASNPRAFANSVYSGRLGNGPPSSNDGFTYRGRGIIQLTGRENYARREAETGIPLVTNPELASDPRKAVEIACLYWTSRHINDFADRDDLVAVRRAVNGGTHGIEQARIYLKRAKSVFKELD